MTRSAITLLAVLLIPLTGCLGFADGLDVARHTGNIRVSVTDQMGVPVPGAIVNNFWFDGVWRTGDNPAAPVVLTNTHGRADIWVNTGRRQVTVTLPAGFQPSADGLVKEVIVIAERRVMAAFVVVRVDRK